MIIAIDTGGTKTLITSFNRSGRIQKQIKFATPPNQKDYIEELKNNLIKNYQDKNVEAIVLASPGIIKDGVIVWGGGNLTWKDLDIKSELSGLLGKAPVFVENDANLAGLGETRLLKKEVLQSLYVTVSTGIGSGIITDGHINQALRNSEAGHALIEYDGLVQEWEKFASGRAIYNTYGKYARDIKSVRIWRQIADRISRGFLAVIPILQPDIIIIGGSIGTYFKNYGDYLQNLLKEKLPEHIKCPRFVQAKYPELAVIYGCYYYAVDNISSKKS